MQPLNRRHFLALSAASFALPSHSFAKNKRLWSTLTPIPIRTQELYGAVHQGRLFIAGGIANKLGVPYFTDACYSYDPAADSWAAEPNLPEALHHAALVSAGERLFLVGGFNGGYSHIWRMRGDIYELINGTWIKIGKLPTPQAEGVLSCHDNGTIHLVTGQTQKGKANKKRSDHIEVNTHLSWRPDESNWQELEPIPTARNSATGGWIGDQLVVAGGRTSAGNLSTTEIYDLQSGQWRTAAPMPLPQAGTASAIAKDGLLVFGGEIFVPNANVFKEAWFYNLRQDRWTALPPMLTPRHGISAGRIGNKVFVVGGATQPGGKGTSDLNEAIDLAELGITFQFA